MPAVKLNVTLRGDHLEEDYKLIITKIRPEWPQEQLKYKMFTDGITNKLLGAYCTDKKQMILIRVYGEKTDLFIDREVEKYAIQLLHKHGLGPELYAEFNNGIVYEYLPGVTLDRDTCRDDKVYPLICDSMARLHSMPTEQSETCMLWEKIEKFISLMPSKFNDHRQERFESEMFNEAEIHAELEYLKDLLSGLDVPLVYSHNDLLLANIIHNQDENKASFIDFEYAGLNYQPFDVANHFNEYAGITEVNYDYFPEECFQLIWIREYLNKYYQYSKPNSGYVVTEEEVKEFYVMTNKFVLASHFFWGVWGLVQAKESSIDFDFLDYGILRMNEYKKVKAKQQPKTV